MNILVLTSGVVSSKQGGSGQFNQAIYSYLISKNCDFQFICLTSKILDFSGYEGIKDKRIELIDLTLKNNFTSRQINKFNFCIKKIEGIRSKLKLLQDIDFSKYNFVITLGLGWGLAMSQRKSVKQLNFLGDPIDLIFLSRINQQSLPKKLFSRLFIYPPLRISYIRSMKKISTLPNVYTFLPQEKIRLAAEQIDIQDFKWFSIEAQPKKSLKFNSPKRLLFLGDRGTTYSQYFEKYTLPKLLQLMQNDNETFMLDLIGRSWESYKQDSGEINKNLNCIGFVKDLDSILQGYDILISIENYSNGVRTRILKGLSANLLIIAHKKAQIGIPELSNNINCLLIDDENEILDIVRNISTNELLYKNIALEGYRMFRRQYSESIFINNLDRVISKMQL
jgi:glycosyltransferase involved in cell wall biosynthesis